MLFDNLSQKIGSLPGNLIKAGFGRRNRRVPPFHISPRIRAYGKARIDIAQRAKSRDEWQSMWKPPANEFPFQWGSYWKQCIEYRVEDFAAEVGFFIDVLGFPVNAFDPDYAQFTSPVGEFFIAVVPVLDGQAPTPADAIRLQFMVADLVETAEELERRGVLFEQKPEPCQPESNLYIGSFRTPHGILVELWGEVTPKERHTYKVVNKPILAEKPHLP